jgi:hypothetical protein
MNWEKHLSRFYKYLVCAGGLFVGVYIAFQLAVIKSPFFVNRFIFQFFDVGHEANLPTYFSVLLFFLLAVVSWVIGVLEKEKGNAVAPWIFTMVLFLFLGLDELAQVHEQLTYHTRALLGTGGFLAFAWTIPYLILVGVLAIYYIPFIWKLQNRNLIFLSAIVFISGAVGMEMIGSYFYDTVGVSHPGYIIASSIEEILEISGLLIALCAFKRELVSRL